MSQTITGGAISFRTKLMDPAAARSFARCISANDTRFQNVELVHSDKAKSEKYFVSFQPRSEHRISALRDSLQDARAERAAAQDFLFWQDPDRSMLTWCYSVSSGETYQVTRADCSCPDFVYRCAGVGLRCKHMVARESNVANVAQGY